MSLQEKEATTVVDLSQVRVTGPLQPCAHGFREQLTELGYTRLSAADRRRLWASVEALVEVSRPRREVADSEPASRSTSPS